MTHEPTRVTALDAPVDLTNCDREPIHVPGAVQPHGALVALRGDEVVQISENLPELLGVGAGLLGQSLDALLPPELAAQVRSALSSGGLERNPLLLLNAAVRGRGPFDLTAHCLGDLTILEFESTPVQPVVTDAYSLVRSALARMNAAATLDHVVEVAAQEVQTLTGFDRVMVYQFADDGTGTVIAEKCGPDVTPYLGLRYPASDIPQQARALYVQNMLRIITDVHYRPARLLALPGEAPLDMSYCVLRSVSPIHVEYLKNMGVGASMSISLLRGAQLWGLIACHHGSPRALSANVRAACELVGQVASVQLSAWQERQDQTYQLQLQGAQAQLMERLTDAPDLMEALVGQGSPLLEFVDATGAVVCLDGEVIRMGRTPGTEQVRALQDWLGSQPEADVVHTRALSELYPPAAAFTDVASGLLGVQLSRRRDYVAWFRPEELQTVTWGGDPSKPVQIAEDGAERLSPRRSFEAWQQTVRGRSVAWLPEEVAAARTLRRALLNIVVRRAEELRTLNDDLTRSNQELARSNADLDAFAYVASHDLKEPLRGLHNYSAFLLETYAQQLDEDGAAKLRTLVRLTQRMDDLIDSLLLYSRVGRVELNFRPTDLNEVLADVLDLLSARLEQAGAHVTAGPLPTLNVDRVRVGEVLNNLISNAVKYTERAQPQIEVGAVAPADRGDLTVPAGVPDDAWILFVRDDGIGIRERHFENIFRIFKRLHARDQFGGGTGAGLTIVKKIVDRHGGQVWPVSTYGAGTTFYFTLQGSPVPEDA